MFGFVIGPRQVKRETGERLWFRAYIRDYFQHLARFGRCILDRFIFCHFRLEPWSGAIVLVGILGSGVSFFFKFGSLAALLTASTIVWAIYSKLFRAPPMKYPHNSEEIGIMLTVQPTTNERRLGFIHLPRPKRSVSKLESIDIVRDGSVVVSEDFNSNCVMNPLWDPKFVIDEKQKIYDSIIRSLQE